MPEQATHQPGSISITPTRLVERTRPAEIVPDPGAGSEEFTRSDFEGALDKVSRDEADVADARAALKEEGGVTWEEVKRKHGL